MKKTLRRLRNWFFALLLLPLLWAVFKHTCLMVPQMGADGWRSWVFYAVGIGSYALVEAVFFKPMWMYVFGHELTHALSGLLSGAKVHSFKASSKGGEVRLSKSNAFIALSPYVVPIYMGFVVILYAIIRHWWNTPELTKGFQFLLGFTLAFHASLTFHAVHGKQPDLKIMGLFLSVVLITLGNLLILGVLGVSLFRKTPTPKQYARLVGNETLVVWKRGIDGSINTLRHWFNLSQSR
jgi:hypothetical protein